MNAFYGSAEHKKELAYYRRAHFMFLEQRVAKSDSECKS